MRKCLKPLIPLTDCDGKLSLAVHNLAGCNSEITHLVLTQGGCDKFQEVVHMKSCEPRGFGCCNVPICLPQVVVETVPVPKGSVTYPLHDMDCDGNAVFILDSKLKQLGYGRYHAQVVHNGCNVLEFDVDYQCAELTLAGISTERSRNMGERC